MGQGAFALHLDGFHRRTNDYDIPGQAALYPEDEDEHEEEGHDEGEHEGEEEHSDEAGHTEFHAEYRLNCDKPAAISQITFAYFDTFANARELDVQIVTEVGAQAFEVERSDPELDLRGVF